MYIKVSVLLVLFLLPLYVVRFTVSGLPTTLLELAVLATIAAWGVEKIRTRTLPAFPRPWRLPAGLFLLASVIALFTAPEFVPALGHWRAYLLEPMLFALILTDTIRTERDQRLVTYTLAASCVIPVAVALYQQYTGNLIPNEFWAAAATRRVTSIYGYPNALGLYAVPILILTMSQVKKSKSQKVIKVICFILNITAIGAIYFTRSKGALIALAMGFAVFYILNAKKRLLTGSIIGIIAIAGFFIFKDSFNLRGISRVQGGDSVSVRLTQYRETWDMLKDRPLLGAGLRGYKTAMAPYHEKKYIEIFLYPHNIFLAVWSELGLLGLISFLWLLVTFFKQYWGSASVQPFNYAAAAAMLALLTHGLVDVPYFKNDLAVLFWALIACTIIINHDRQTEKNMIQ